GERRGACAVSDVERLPQQLSSFGAPIAPADHGAEVGEGARSVDLRVPALELVDRLAEQGLAAIAAGDDARRTLGNTERARRAERQRELDLLFCEPSGRLPIAEREMSKRRLRTPREKGRAGDHRLRQADTDGKEVFEPFGNASLLDAKPSAREAEDTGRQ